MSSVVTLEFTDCLGSRPQKARRKVKQHIPLTMYKFSITQKGVHSWGHLLTASCIITSSSWDWGKRTMSPFLASLKPVNGETHIPPSPQLRKKKECFKRKHLNMQALAFFFLFLSELKCSHVNSSHKASHFSLSVRSCMHTHTHSTYTQIWTSRYTNAQYNSALSAFSLHEHVTKEKDQLQVHFCPHHFFFSLPLYLRSDGR